LIIVTAEVNDGIERGQSIAIDVSLSSRRAEGPRESSSEMMEGVEYKKQNNEQEGERWAIARLMASLREIMHHLSMPTIIPHANSFP